MILENVRRIIGGCGLTDSFVRLVRTEIEGGNERLSSKSILLVSGERFLSGFCNAQALERGESAQVG